MIIVKNRELLIPNHERYIGTTYDNEAENRVFQVPRFSQRGVDLAALTFRLDIQYANEAFDTVLLDKEVGEAFIILIWRITSSTLQVPGTLYIGLRAIDDEATVKWSSFSAAMYAERHLNTPGNYGGSLTEIEQIEQDHQYMKGVVDELKANIDYAHDAEAWAKGTRSGSAVPSTDPTYHNNSKYYSEQASASKNAAANSATAAAESATQAAETVSDTNTRFNNAMKAVTSETEVIDARVGADGTTYPVLKTRLDTEHTQLKNALEASAVQTEAILPKGTITADSWYQNNGVVGSHSGYSRTEKLALNDVYAIKVNFNTEAYRVHFYDAHSSRIVMPSYFTLVADQFYVVPSTAAYIGISGVTASMSSLVITTLTNGAVYDALTDKVNVAQGAANRDGQFAVDDTGNVVAHKYFSNASSVCSKNLFNPHDITVGIDLDGNVRSGYASTGFIRVYKGTQYCVSVKSGISIYQQHGYDEYGNVINKAIDLSATAKTLSDDIKFIRICLFWNPYSSPSFGVYARINSYSGVDVPYDDAPDYYAVDKAFDRFHKQYGFLADKSPVLAESGRYSGTEDIEQYSRLVHSTNNSLAIHTSVPGDQWYERSVKQYFSATTITITKNSGVNGLYSTLDDIDANIGDTVYVGFLCRTADGQPHSCRLSTQDYPSWQDIPEPIYFDKNIRLYEFSHVLTENDGILKWSIEPNPGFTFEFSNIYVRTSSNAKYEHIFKDPAREEVIKYIISENLKTKTLVAFGDSVTAAGYYLDSFRKRIPVGTFINEGIGGSCFCYTNTSTGSNFYNVVETKQADIEAADIVTVSYGTNDSGYLGKTTTIGSIAPIGSAFDLLTTYGAIQSGLEKIIGYNPSARIVMIIPATWNVYDYREPIAKAIRDCAELYGCMVIDFRECGCNQLTQTGMTLDGLHPTRDTGELCGKLMVDALASIYML